VKSNLFFIIFLLILASCAGNKKLSKVAISNRDNEISDSTEYELIIFDPGFETWYLSHSKPDWYHSKDYYETWNRQYVTAWNSKAMDMRYSRFFESTIDYDPFVDYGLELNHKLFYYFMYVEKGLKIPILPPGTGPQSVL
jgi:thioredoxin-related protein